MEHHGAGLRRVLTSEGVATADQDALIHSLSEWPHEALRVSARERALLRYADKLTLTPSRVTPEDVAALREVGLDDRAIHDACAIVAYFAFVNRIADGLGVELEETDD